MKKIIVAIDGFSSSGKSTMAKQLAAAVGYAYIDSGAMYRAITLYAMRHGFIRPDGSVDTAALCAALPDIRIEFRYVPEAAASHTFLNGEDVEREIRSLEVSSHVSPVAAVPEVRHALTAMMQQYGEAKGIVMDGRDIGTTVFPAAEMKVFVNASPEVRARRRYDELRAKGDEVDYEQVLANVQERDEIDRNRKESPLRQAPDALVLDNDNLTREEQSAWLLDTFRRIADE
ncbi:MAG: (d)CMP kinase [Bacteroidales bacterium]|nr:(d)CMP kinase [Bacteroidales bacterium]